MKSLFTGMDSSSHTKVSSTQLIYSFMSFFNLFIYFTVIANIYIYFFKSIAWNLLSRIPYSVSVSVSGSPIPRFSAAAKPTTTKMAGPTLVFYNHSHALDSFTNIASS